MDTIVSTITIIASIIGSAVFLAYWMGRKFKGIELEIHDLRKSSNGQLGLLGQIIGILHER